MISESRGDPDVAWSLLNPPAALACPLTGEPIHVRGYSVHHCLSDESVSDDACEAGTQVCVSESWFSHESFGARSTRFVCSAECHCGGKHPSKPRPFAWSDTNAEKDLAARSEFISRKSSVDPTEVKTLQ